MIRGTVGAGESRLREERQYNVIKPDGASARKLPFDAARNSQPSHAATAPQLTRTKWPRILHSAVIRTVVNHNTVHQNSVTVRQSVLAIQGDWATAGPHKVHDFDDENPNLVSHHDQLSHSASAVRSICH